MKKVILAGGTGFIGDCILACTHLPKVWINDSTATIYRHAEDRPMTEKTGEIGSGFSVDVATNWEKTFFAFDREEWSGVFNCPAPILLVIKN